MGHANGVAFLVSCPREEIAETPCHLPPTGVSGPALPAAAAPLRAAALFSRCLCPSRPDGTPRSIRSGPRPQAESTTAVRDTGPLHQAQWRILPGHFLACLFLLGTSSRNQDGLGRTLSPASCDPADSTLTYPPFLFNCPCTLPGQSTGSDLVLSGRPGANAGFLTIQRAQQKCPPSLIAIHQCAL